MTRPIPLSSPDGRVYVYACGCCHHVRHGGDRLCRLTGPDEVSAQMSLRQAERCCTCRRCGMEIAEEPKPFDRYHDVCPACRPAEKRADRKREKERAKEAAAEAAAYENALAWALDRDAAVRLVECMSEISEDYLCASWESGLEYDLWRLVEGTTTTYAGEEVPQADVATLRRLSEKAGGWWQWDGGRRFVLLDAWRELFTGRNRA